MTRKTTTSTMDNKTYYYLRTTIERLKKEQPEDTPFPDWRSLLLALSLELRQDDDKKRLAWCMQCTVPSLIEICKEVGHVPRRTNPLTVEERLERIERCLRENELNFEDEEEEIIDRKLANLTDL